MATAIPRSYTFIVEHLDPELGPWSALEYRTIAAESRASKNHFLLSSVPPDLLQDPGMEAVREEGGRVEKEGVEVLFPPNGEQRERNDKEKVSVCLLDPRAEIELSPEDGEKFGGFLFGGILGMYI